VRNNQAKMPKLIDELEDQLAESERLQRKIQKDLRELSEIGSDS